jgi:hypothetical protein
MTGTPQFICYICNKPIKLEEAKTDANGRAIHEECCVVATLLRTSVDTRKEKTALQRGL